MGWNKLGWEGKPWGRGEGWEGRIDQRLSGNGVPFVMFYCAVPLIENKTDQSI